MQSRTIVRIAAVALAAGFLSACDQASRDVGADLAACILEADKSNFADIKGTEASAEDALMRGDFENHKVFDKRRWELRRQHASLCMRGRGWQLKNKDRCADTRLPDGRILMSYVKSECYERAKSGVFVVEP